MRRIPESPFPVPWCGVHQQNDSWVSPPSISCSLDIPGMVQLEFGCLNLAEGSQVFGVTVQGKYHGLGMSLPPPMGLSQPPQGICEHPGLCHTRGAPAAGSVPPVILESSAGGAALGWALGGLIFGVSLQIPPAGMVGGPGLGQIYPL